MPLVPLLIFSQITLRDALGNLMMQGCTGGTFLSQEVSSLHHWIDFEGPYMLVDFNRAPINSAYPLPHWSVRYEFHLSRDELTKSEWWNWNDFLPPPDITRPPWWSVTNMEDAKVCTMVSVSVLRTHFFPLLIALYANNRGF